MGYRFCVEGVRPFRPGLNVDNGHEVVSSVGHVVVAGARGWEFEKKPEARSQESGVRRKKKWRIEGG
jgi:hypothetical protein